LLLQAEIYDSFVRVEVNFGVETDVEVQKRKNRGEVESAVLNQSLDGLQGQILFRAAFKAAVFELIFDAFSELDLLQELQQSNLGY